MKKNILISKLQRFLGLLLLLPLASSAQVLPPDAVVDGKNLGDWLAEWWKWILPIPITNNPAFDPDGRFAHVGQPDGPVFFMVKGYNFTFVPRRSFEVPEGKYLFMPLLTDYESSLDIEPPLSVPELQDIAAGQVMLIDELHFEIDGVPVPNLFSYRARAPAFSIEFTEPDNLFAWGQGYPFPRPTDPVPALVDPVVADGYAVLVAPLTPGVHVIRVGGHVGSPIDRGTSGTSTVTVVSIPLTQLVEGLIVDLKSAGLPVRQMRPLLETLRKAHDAFESGHSRAGIIRLRIFQHKLRHFAPPDPVLAKQLTQGAQRIIDKATAQWERLREGKKAGESKGHK